MTLTNHALTGSVVGLVIDNPLVAIPVAFASHFICDAIPHFGLGSSTEILGSANFRRYLVTDALLCVGLVIVLAVTRPEHWLLAAVCAFLATSPDMAWLPGWLRTRRGLAFKSERPNLFMRFAARIQWYEKPLGALVEAAWLASAVSILVLFIR